MSEFGMFTAEGDQLVGRIVTAGQRIAAEDGAQIAWTWAHRALEKLSYADNFGEAMDTMVREIVYGEVLAAADDRCDFYL
jgi:hypothetical protein